MNNYEELPYEELVKIERELLSNIRNKKMQSEESDEQLKALCNELEQFERDKELQIKKRKEEALKEVIDEKTRPVLQEIEKQYNKKKVFTDDYNKHVKTINRANFITEESSQLLDDKNHLKGIIYDSKELIKEIVGEGFYNNLMKRFSQSTTTVDLNDFKSLKKVIYDSTSTLKRLQKISKFNLMIYINKYFSNKKSIFFFLDSTHKKKSKGKKKKDKDTEESKQETAEATSEQIKEAVKKEPPKQNTKSKGKKGSKGLKNLDFKSMANNLGSDNSKIFMYLIICVVITAFIILKGSCILFILLVFTLVINMVTSYKVYQLSYNMKCIEDSIDDVEDIINKEIDDKMNAKLNKAKNILDSNMAKIDSIIDEYTSEQSRIIQDLTNNFQPDLSKINDDMKTKFEAKYKAKSSLQNQNLKLITDIQNLKEDLTEIKKVKDSRFEEMVYNIANSNEAGTSHLLPEDIVIDANFDLKRLIKWKFPKSASIILYDSDEELHEFMLCMVNQLLSYVYFRDLELSYFDMHTFGSPLLQFKQSVRNPNDLFFMVNIVTDSDSEKAEESRIKVNINEFISKAGALTTFEDFNDRMRAKESSTIPYRVMIYKDVEPKKLVGEDLTKSLSTMAKAGIIPMYFLAKENLDELGEKDEKALRRYENFYNLFGGHIEPLPWNTFFKFVKGNS